METIKSLIGLGGTKEVESHAEPVNGTLGAGTAEQPYDAGNTDDTSLGSKAAESVASPSTTSALEGQEPISGEQGVGTAAKPFDAGNNDSPALGGAAAQQLPSEHATSDAPISESTKNTWAPAATSTSANEAPSAETRDLDTSAGPAAGALTSSDADPTLPSTAAKSEEPTAATSGSEAAPIGSAGWFKTALPFGLGKSEPQAASGATEAPAESVAATESAVPKSVAPESSLPEGIAAESAVSEKATATDDLPPNQFGEQVPEGLSKNIVDPAEATSSTSAINETTEKPFSPISAAGAESSLPATEATSPTFTPAADSGLSATTPKAPADTPSWSNPSAIPTAGGVRIGSVQEERRKSHAISPSELPPVKDEVETPSVPASGATLAPPTQTTESGITYREDGGVSPMSEPPTAVGAASSPSVQSPVTSSPSAAKSPVRSSLEKPTGKSSLDGGERATESKSHHGLLGKLKEKLHHHKDK